jgi:hypothetical protein
MRGQRHRNPLNVPTSLVVRNSFILSKMREVSSPPTFPWPDLTRRPGASASAEEKGYWSCVSTSAGWPMRRRAMARWGVFGIILVSLAAGIAHAGQDVPSPPVFTPNPNAGWISYGPEYIPEPSGPQPVTSDPAHPFVNNPIEYNAARPGTKDESEQSTFPVADLTNPILQPWVREELRKLNERVLTGRPLYSRQTSCWPTGIPTFLLYVVNPVFFLQRPEEVTILAQSDHMIRHIYMNVPHKPNPKPSWYGESVGHYEADTLVVDTIGITTKAFVDNYRTPHTDKLHVVERFRMIEGGKTLEVKIHVQDEGAFTTTWDASQRYARVMGQPLGEIVCAENNANYFNHEVEPIPQANRADF